MSAVQKLDFVGVPSQDAERSRTFYPDGNNLMLHRRYAPYSDAAAD